MSDLEEFNEECIYSHNGLRQSHGVGPLVYNKTLALAAQKYAEIIAANERLEHSAPEDRDNSGENLASSMRPFDDYLYSGRGATVNWYAEIKDYVFEKEGQDKNNKPTGHFTQVIWKESKEAGFGRVKNPQSGIWYIVGRYQPPGNVVRKFKINVPSLQGNIKWEDVPSVQEYLDELRTWEFTDARKHVLDVYNRQLKIGKKQNIPFCEITETFTQPNGETYSETKSFTSDPTDQPRPQYSTKHNPSKNIIQPPKESQKNQVHFDEFDPTRTLTHSIVERHNFYRKKHHVGLLKLDDQLTELAQSWADEIASRKQMRFSHFRINNSDIGENLTYKSGIITKKTGEELVDEWYVEKKHFVYGKEPKNVFNVGHFSQIVWKTSKRVGVGVAEYSPAKSYIVCFYHPSGNIINGFSDNVSKPTN